MKRDPAEIEAALKALDAAMQETEPDYSWADDLPEAPPIPSRPDQTVAVFIPTRSDHGTAQGAGNIERPRTSNEPKS